MSRRVPPTIGRYRIRKLLGMGGQAEAFLGELGGPGGFSKVAVVKRMLPHAMLERRSVEQFLHEGRVGLRLQHENVVQIYEVGEESGYPFIAMEYIAGLTWRTAVRRVNALRQRLRADVVLRAASDVAKGLDYAHNLVDERGRPTPLVHRDISPDNLMLSREGVTKILDFGIVKETGEEGVLTRTGELKGKIGFMSPEQLNGEDLDGRADLFSLGVTLYWMMSGKRPFRGKNEIDVLKKVLYEEPIPVHEAQDGIPLIASQIVMKLLDKDRDARTSSAGELVKQLRDLVGRADQAGHSAKFAEEMLLHSAAPPEDRTKDTSPESGPSGAEVAEVDLGRTGVMLKEIPIDQTIEAHAPMTPDEVASLPAGIPVDTLDDSAEREAFLPNAGELPSQAAADLPAAGPHAASAAQQPSAMSTPTLVVLGAVLFFLGIGLALLLGR